MVCDMRGCDRSDQLQKIERIFRKLLLKFLWNFGLFFEEATSGTTYIRYQRL